MYADCSLERDLNKKGFSLVCGIDEVGRGSFAGPLVVASVILPRDCRLELRDSKLLSPESRIELSIKIKNESVAHGIGWVNNQEVDRLGLTKSTQLACIRALVDMDSVFSLAIIDGNINYLQKYEMSKSIIKADSKIACVAAASIIAKVARDEYMIRASKKYPVYGFERNVGYGTQSHRQALREHGPSNLHRKSFLRNYA